MSAATMAQHKPTELTYHGTRDDVAIFSAPSTSRAGARNVIVRDVATGEAHCECRAAECGRQCWHLDWIETAWAMVQVAPFIASLDDAALVATGAAAARRCAANEQTATDIAVMWQARADYCRRQRAARAALTAPSGRVSRGCPDCGTPTRSAYLCADCAGDLLAARSATALAAMGVAA